MNVKSKYIRNKKTIIPKHINKKVSQKMIIINSPTQKPYTKKYNFKYGEDILNTDFKTIQTDDIEKLVVCIYRINTIENNYLTSNSYLEYLLYKYPPSIKKKSLKNTCVFPFIKFNKKKSIKVQTDNLVYTLTNTKIENKGFLEKNNNIYVFYEISDEKYKNNNIKYLDSSVELWWALMDEICNHRKILTFTIHKSVFELFYKNPQLIFIRDSNRNKINIPSVGYIGGDANSLPTIVLSIDTSQSYDHKMFGSFNHAVKQGGWSPDLNEKYTKGGIVRFALFTKISDSLINIKNNLSKFKKDPDKWKHGYDSIIIGKIGNKNKYFNINPYFNIKSVSQKTPLSIHLLNMKTVKKWDPFSNEYNIE